MKKLIFIIFSLVFVFSALGCSGAEGTSTTTTEPTTQTEEQPYYASTDVVAVYIRVHDYWQLNPCTEELEHIVYLDYFVDLRYEDLDYNIIEITKQITEEQYNVLVNARRIVFKTN